MYLSLSEQDIKIWYRIALSNFTGNFKISAKVTYFHSVCPMLMLYTANIRFRVQFGINLHELVYQK